MEPGWKYRIILAHRDQCYLMASIPRVLHYPWDKRFEVIQSLQFAEHCLCFGWVSSRVTKESVYDIGCHPEKKASWSVCIPFVRTAYCFFVSDMYRWALRWAAVYSNGFLNFFFLEIQVLITLLCLSPERCFVCVCLQCQTYPSSCMLYTVKMFGRHS